MLSYRTLLNALTQSIGRFYIREASFVLPSQNGTCRFQRDKEKITLYILSPKFAQPSRRQSGLIT